MMTTEEISLSEKTRQTIAQDKDFEILVNDLKDTVSRLRRTQEDRIREANRVGVKKDGDLQKNIEARSRELSEKQRELVETDLAKKIELEKAWIDRAKELVERHPVHKFTGNVTGIGTILEAILFSQIDVVKINYVSQIYAFSGIVTGHDKLVKGQKATFNKFLKTKLLGVAATEFIKTRSEYAQYYYREKIRLMNRDLAQIAAGQMLATFPKKNEELSEADQKLLKRHTKAHIDCMAKRFMIQSFLLDYYKAARTILGMPVINGYAEEKLGTVHVGENVTDWEEIVKLGTISKEEKKEARQKTFDKLKELKEKCKEIEALCHFPKQSKEEPEEDSEASE